VSAQRRVVCVMLDKTEDNAKLQAVVSLLTTGPVAVSDKMDYTDIDLVHKSVSPNTASHFSSYPQVSLT